MSSTGRPATIRILHLYFIRETLPPTAAAFGLYTFVMLINQLFLLVEYAYKYDVPVGKLGWLFALQLPHIVVLTLPMALLVGLLVAAARWSADSEIVALSANGMSISLLLRPVMVLALVFTLFTTFLSFELMPRGNRAITREIFEIFRQNLLKSVKEREFTTRLLSSSSLYIQRIEHGEREDVWHGVLLDPGNAGRDRREVYFARTAVPSVDTDSEKLILTLQDVTVHGWMQSDRSVHDVQRMQSYTQVLPPPPLFRKPETESVGSNRSVRELTFSELLQQRNSLRTDDLALLRLTQVELHKRIAIPFACFVFALLGLGAGATSRRSGRAFGFLFSLVVFLAYYQTFYAGERLAVMGELPPWLAMWIGNLIFGLLGGIVYFHRATEGRVLLQARRRWNMLGLAKALRRPDRPVKSASAVTVDARPAQAGRTGRALGFPPTILDRYILGHFFKVLLMVLGCLIGLFVTVTWFQYLDDIRRHNIPLATVIALYVAWLPEILSYVLPMAVLVSTVVAFSLLTRTNEITAMLVNGISLRRVVAPVLAAACVLTAFTFVLYDRWLPRSSERFNELDQQIKTGTTARPNFTPSRWVPLTGNRRFLHYDSFDRSRGIFYRVSIYEIDSESFEPRQLVSARRGRWQDYRLLFDEGAQREFSPTGDILNYHPFTEKALPFLEQRPDFARDWRDPRHMTYSELLAFINWKKEHVSETRELTIELKNKRAYPLVTFVMALLGLPFAFSIGKRGSLHGIGIAIVIAAVYWSAVILAGYLGKLGALPPELAAWGPNFLFGSVGFAAFLNLRT